MSAITSDWTPLVTEARVARAAESGDVYRREEEFRSALDNYMARYIADRNRGGALAIQSFAEGTLYGGWSFTKAVSSIIEGLSARLATGRGYRAELRDYSPEQLTELGISEADIDFIAEDASRS